MKKKIKVGLILALVCLALVSLSACGEQTTEIQTQYIEVSRGDLVVSVSADGNLSFLKDRKLTFGISGTITEINVGEGDRVTEGEVLARLDAASLELAVKAAELAVKTAEVKLEIATNEYRKIAYPYTYSTFAFDVPAALAAIADAQRELNEAVKSLEIGLSFDQYWEVWHQLKQAQDKLTEAKQRLARGRGEDVFESGILSVADFWTLRAAELGMEQARLALDSAKNDLVRAKNELDKAVIVAPFDGVIAAVNVKKGDKLSSMDYATKTIVELIDPASMELNAEVDEIDIPNVKLGQRAIINVDALPKVQLQGEVTSISPLATEESGLILYKIKISLDVPKGSGLKLGMSATADIIIDERSSVLLVPSQAIGQNSLGNPVVKVMVNGQIEERAVVIGITDGYQTEILDGLDEGEVVVIEKKAPPKPSGGFIFGG
jgi:RND family efflux transporter MFP subunit